MRHIAYVQIVFDSVGCGSGDQFRYFDTGDIELVRAFVAYHVGRHGDPVLDIGLIECAESDRRFNCLEPKCKGVLYTAEAIRDFKTLDVFEPVRRELCGRCYTMLIFFGHDSQKCPEWFARKFPESVPRP